MSTDIVGDPVPRSIDLELTRVVDGTLVKVMAWYDNEWGFTHQMIRGPEHPWRVQQWGAGAPASTSNRPRTEERLEGGPSGDAIVACSSAAARRSRGR